MHSKSDKIEIMINDKADEIIKKCFESLLNRYQIGLETSNILDCVHLLYHKCHEINFKRSGSYIDSSDLIKKQKSNNRSYQ